MTAIAFPEQLTFYAGRAIEYNKSDDVFLSARGRNWFYNGGFRGNLEDFLILHPMEVLVFNLEDPRLTGAQYKINIGDQGRTLEIKYRRCYDVQLLKFNTPLHS